MAKDVKFNIKLAIDGKEQIVTASTNVKKLAEELEIARTKSTKLRDDLLKITQVGASFQNVITGMQQFTGIMRAYTAASATQEEAEVKLATVMRQRMGASDGEVESIKKLASAQQEIGVIGDEVQLAGAQQIATFLNQKSSLDVLIPAMNNLLAQQKGLSATGEDAVAIGNLMGKAMQGQAGALRRVGITFTEAQEQVMKYGNETQRASMLAEIITDNVGNMNSEIAKTDAGRVKQMQNAFGDVKEEIGKTLASYEPFIEKLSELGYSVSGIAMMTTGLISLSKAFGITKIATKATTAVMRSYSVTLETVQIATNSAGVASKVAAVGITALKTAVKGLIAASVIGLGITLLVSVFEKLSQLSDASEKTAGSIDVLKDSTEQVKRVFDDTNSSTFSNLMTSFRKLQAEWKNLSDSQKTKWIKDNQHEFANLGLKIRGVADAENAFQKNTGAVTKAFVERAKAAATMAQLTEEYRIYMQLADKIQAADAAANSRHRVKAGDVVRGSTHTTEGGYEEVNASGNWVYTEKSAAKNNSTRWRANNAEAKSNRAAMAASVRRSKQLERQVERHARSTSVVIPGPASDTSKSSVNNNKHAIGGSIDAYEEKLEALRKKIYATPDMGVAKELQKQYRAVEEDLKNRKVAIGLEDPKKEDVKTYVEKLQDNLKDAEENFNNALTVEARVAASTKVDEIQAEINAATSGELTIPAQATPSYIVKGSKDDIRQSYANAQTTPSLPSR